MSWLRLDDDGWAHPKVLSVGNEAYGAWCRAGQWSRKYGTDGRIPRAVALTIARTRIWRRLADVGLVEPDADGYQIHDFLAYNPPAEPRPPASSHSHDADIRRKRQEAGRIGAARRWQPDGTLPSTDDGAPMASAMAGGGKQDGKVPSATELPGSRSLGDPDPIPDLLGTVERGSGDVHAMRAHGKRARADSTLDGTSDGRRPPASDGKPWPPPAREPKPGPASAEDILAWTAQHQCLVALIRDAAAAWEWAHDVEGSLAAAGARAEDARDAIAEFVAQHGTAARGWSREEVQRRLGGFLKRARDVGAQGRARRERAAGGGRAPAMLPTPPEERLWTPSVPATAGITDADVEEARRQWGTA